MLSSSIDYFGNMDDSLSLSGLLFTPFCRSASKKAESSASSQPGPRYGVRARSLAEVLVGFPT